MKRDSVSAYVHMRRDTPLPLYVPLHFLDDSPPFPWLRTYLMDGLFLNQKKNNRMTSVKIYWSILKLLLINKKFPCIPPLFHQNKYVTDFRKKAELFNCFFASVL